MASRGMTPEEYQFALSIFERDFPVRDDIELDDGTGIDGRQFVRPTVIGDPYKKADEQMARFAEEVMPLLS